MKGIRIIVLIVTVALCFIDANCKILCENIDSIIVNTIPLNVNYSNAITREIFMHKSHRTKFTIIQHRQIQQIIHEINQADFVSLMPYDTTHSISEFKFKKNIADWFSIDDDDYRGLLIVCRKDKYDVLWLSRLYLYYDKYKYKCSKELLSLIFKD